jgi:hypothetical protein
MSDKTTYKDVDSFFSDFESRKDAIAFEGFIEKEEGSQTRVRFAPNGNCAYWLSLPSSAITELEVLKPSEWCFTEKDGAHTHPLVRISIDSSNIDAAGAISRFASVMLSQKQRPPLRQVVSSTPGPIAASQKTPSHFYLPSGARAASGMRPMAPKANCPDGYRCVYYDGCQYNCACVNDDDMAFCSACCIA